MKLENKTAVITGGAGGIGKATAHRMLAEGANVLLTDVNAEGLEEARKELASDRLRTITADVTQSAEVKKYVDEARNEFGSIDVFFDNAGIEGDVAMIPDYPEQDFDKVMDINVKGAWLGLKHVLPVMQDQGSGSVIVTSSVAGLSGTPGVSAYVMSKHALIGMMRTAALEAAPFGVRVNSVHPAPVNTRMMRSLEKDFQPDNPNQVKEDFEQEIPLGRYGEPQDVASLVTFLGSEDSSYITGATYTVDGGMLATA